MKPAREAGMTLVELLIAGAISMAITGLLGTSVYQFFTITRQGSEAVSALHQIQNAAHWINRDGQSADAATGGDRLVLTITNGSTVTYSLWGDELRRTAGLSEIIVARHVGSLTFHIDGAVVTTDISISPRVSGNITERATFKTCLRPESGGGG